MYGFSFIDTDNPQDNMGTIFIPLYHFYLLTIIDTFICSLVPEIATLYFQLQQHM